jgi:phospholipid/cholesterol/gamma-HCH transport system substrate-binding protein
MRAHTIKILILLLVAIIVVVTLFNKKSPNEDIAQRLENSYQLTAHFDNVSGLKVGSMVAIAGVEIGEVTGIIYEAQTYQVLVTIIVDKKYSQLPVDSSAAIYTIGMMGEKYLAIEPGGAAEFLQDGGELELTQSSLIIEQLIGQFLFSQTQSDFK